MATQQEKRDRMKMVVAEVLNEVWDDFTEADAEYFMKALVTRGYLVMPL
jgi:hypothetical protein